MKRIVVAPEAAVRTLTTQPFLAGVDTDTIEELAGQIEFLALATGESLLTEGDPGDAAFIIVSGRFEIVVGEENQARTVRESSKGELIGELALLTNAPRSASAIATRDSVVARLDRAVLDGFLDKHPAMHSLITAQLIDRLRGAERGSQQRRRAAVLSVVTDGRPVTRSFVHDLKGALERSGVSHVVVDLATGVDEGGIDVGELEARHDLVVLVPDPLDEHLVRWAGRHCDRLVFAADGGAPSPAPSAPRARLDLVLVHDADRSIPTGTARWLREADPAGHRHVRVSDAGDHDRLLRYFLDEEIVLVLGGGGARGLAHVGVHRALLELNVPVDAIVGVSAGTIFGAGIASGWSFDRLRAEADSFMISAGSPVDRTFPIVALARGAELTRRAKAGYGVGSVEIEDLWLPFSCLSANLTTADLHVHRTGLLWRAVRASVAIPGVFPPLAEPEGLLIDGGIIDNLPIATARAAYPGARIIASDVGRRDEMPPDGFPIDGVVSGWSALAARVLPGRKKLPTIAALLGRLTALGSAGTTPQRGDVHIVHDLGEHGRFGFRRGDEIIDAGYETARQVLAEADLW